MPEGIVTRVLRLPGYGIYAWEADELVNTLTLWIRNRRDLEPSPAHHAREARTPHRARHRPAADDLPPALELFPDLAGAIDFPIVPPHAPDLLAQPLVVADPRRPACGIALPCLELVIDLRGKRQHRADRLDPVLAAMGIDEPPHHFARRSTSTWAKHADAFLRI